MNHKNGFNPLSRTTAHRRAMSRNMVTSLFRYERITTTKSKALEVRKSAEKLITRAKEDSVHNRREVAKFIADEKILNKLFTEIAPRMKERNGGYTRVLKLGYRQGDAADVVILELVDYKLESEAEEKKPAKKAEGSAPKAKTTKAKADGETKSKKPAAKKTTEKKDEAKSE
ncbi:MAG: 50S ribosomal protein L17 [Treponema sp.]|nr:50S ribosomal protein L17 [Treponema sp.]